MKTPTSKTPFRSRGLTLAVALFAALGCQQLGANESYYRWVDDQGETIMSDRPPPPGIEYEIVDAKSSITRSAEDGGGTAEDGGEDRYITAESQKDPEMCQQAKDNLEALTQSDRVTIRDESGELRMLTAEEIAAQIEMTRGHIVIFCGSAQD